MPCGTFSFYTIIRTLRFGANLLASNCENDLIRHGYLKEPYIKNDIVTSALTDKGIFLLALYRLFYEA